MKNRKWIIGALVCTLLAACSTPPEPVTPSAPDNPNLLVSGNVVRVDTEFSYNGKANFREGAHAVVTLCYFPGFDGPCEQVVTQRIENVRAFPIPFLLEGDPETFFSRQGYYEVGATVYMELSDDIYIGDFLDERFDEISKPTSDMTIVTNGLEKCGTGGGGCASTERP